MRKVLFRIKVPTAKLGTESVIKHRHKHPVNFEKKTILMVFSDPSSTLDWFFLLPFFLESLKQEIERRSNRL